MKILTHTTIATVALSAVLLAASPPSAEACGFYSAEDAVGHYARWMFAHRPGTELERLAERYPDLDRAELPLLIGGRSVRVRSTAVKERRATALVQVDRPGEAGALLSVTLKKRGAYRWTPVAIRRANRHERRAVELVDGLRQVSRRLMTSASAALARR